MSKANQPLAVLLDGRVVGTVTDNKGRLGFTYNEEWRSVGDSYPLSLSMPLASSEHRHAAVEAYLWGLLPDNERTLGHYAKTFGVSARNPVAILRHIGADCAGAIQLIPPEQVPAFEGRPENLEVEWISATEVARELRAAKETGLPGTDRRTLGRFSLAGAQPKIALVHQAGKWGKALGRTPTTHILKPPASEFPGFAENEHLCLDLASELDLGAASSTVESFEDQVAIVVKRFDRLPTSNGYRRIHQEDVCQALSVLPWNKYESDGGPGIPAVVGLLNEHSIDHQADQDRFLDVIALNWVLAATDAHAKNYAFLHVPGGGIRLAPFYDVASYLPYSDRRLHDVKLAMRVGKEYAVRKVALNDWKNLAAALRLSNQYVVDRLLALLSRVPDATRQVAEKAANSGLDETVIQELATRITSHSRDCLKRIQLGLTAA